MSHSRAKEMEAVSMKGAHYDMRFHAPDYSIKENPESLEFEKLCREYVEIALKFFNKSKQAKKVGEYELVEVGDVSGFDRGMEGFWYHTNFKAKPKNASEAEAELFFAELNHRYPQRVKCVKCCILGPIDSGISICYHKILISVDHSFLPFVFASVVLSCGRVYSSLIFNFFPISCYVTFPMDVNLNLYFLASALMLREIS